MQQAAFMQLAAKHKATVQELMYRFVIRFALPFS
jgi:hypothetical protein